MDKENQKRIEDLVPSGVVGIGASAGGLEALQRLFTNLPEDTGLAYVIIQHLSPDYKSLLAEILGKSAKMPVVQAENDMLVEKNRIYVIPPKYNIKIKDGLLNLVEYEQGVIKHPIDVFFKSLANAYGSRAVATVLSGTGSDGTNGIKAIKENGGLIIIEDIETAKFDGMPKSAMATGLADIVLSPEMIARELTHIAANMGSPKSLPLQLSGTTLPKIYALLKDITSINYSYYKQTTVIRRIERRMMINHKQDLNDYYEYLVSNVEEVRILSKEILIGVTNFFRQPDYFENLKDKVIKELMKKPEKELNPIRIWAAGCSTGEEAYSLAILCMEAMEELGISRRIKIFATDLDQEAVALASKGEYRENIIEDVNALRLSKYFNKRGNTYVIKREIRELIVFAQHNVFQDPPFGKLDLICCRNVMIYFQPVLQQELFSIFHSVLNDKGYLFLGKSEAVAGFSEVFLPYVLENRIFVHRKAGRAPNYKGPHYVMPNFERSGDGGEMRYIEEKQEQQKDNMHLKALETLMPACILVNDKDEIKHVFGDCSKYISFPAGTFVMDVFAFLTDDLRIAVSTALSEVRENPKRLTYTDIPVHVEDKIEKVAITIMPLVNEVGSEEDLIAISFTADKLVEPEGEVVPYDIDTVSSKRIADLEKELHMTKEKLRHSVSELGTVNEELQTTNEELLTANEELQSSNEELQSVNEELYTVNSEYQAKAAELSAVNDDMNNFLWTTLIGIIFIDRDLNMRKFTDFICKEFHVVEQDAGRSLKYFAFNFVQVDLMALSKKVLQNLIPIEQEIISNEGKMYFIRIAPYRSEDSKILGLVMTLVDMSNQSVNQEQLDEMATAIKTAYKANDEREQFMSRVSHELRTPMNSILGLTYLALESDSLEEIKENVLKIQSTSNYMFNKVKGVLETGKLTAKKLELTKNKVLEKEIFENVLNIAKEQAQERQIKFVFTERGCDNCLILADAQHTSQVLLKIIENAIKYTPKNGHVWWEVEVDYTDNGMARHLHTIRDTGSGISEEMQKRINLPFDYDFSSENTEAEVFGYGIASSRALIELMDGSLRCESRQGEGTVFTVALSYDVLTAENAANVKMGIGEMSEASLAGKRVLLCEDHELSAQVIQNLLKSKYIETERAENGKEAFEKLMSAAPGYYQCILMDLRMPIMDGIEATEKIRQSEHPDGKVIPIIALTADVFEYDIKFCEKAGMDEYLAKPVDPSELFRMLEKLIR